MLNPHSPIPLYHQLANILMERIRSEQYSAGSKIPSEHSLAETYGIGRPTARQAIDLLVRKRVLLRRRGSGTYVRPKQDEVDLFSLAGTISSFHKKGLPIATEILRKTRLKTIGPEPENPYSGRKAYCFSRLSRVEGAPVLIEDIYLDPDLFAGIDEIDLARRSLSQIVDERYFMRPAGGRQSFRIGYLRGEKAKALAVSRKTPVLVVKRFLHFPQAENAIYSELYCRTDRFVFSQTIGGMIDD